MDEMFQMKLLLKRLAACAHPAQQQPTVETLQLHIWNVSRLALSCAAVPPATTGSLAAIVVSKQKLSMSIKTCTVMRTVSSMVFVLTVNTVRGLRKSNFSFISEEP